MSAPGGQGHREFLIYVCEKCGRPHQNTIGGCIIEFDSAGDTRAELQQISVVSLDAITSFLSSEGEHVAVAKLAREFRGAA